MKIKIIEKLWAGTIVLYSFGATFIVWKTLAKYGVNPILFFVIDVCTSWPYGIATARMVVKIVERDWIAVRKWTVIAALTFVTPQVYILAAAHHAPRDVYVIIITVLALLALVTIVSLIVKIRRAISGNLPKERLKKPSQPT